MPTLFWTRNVPVLQLEMPHLHSVLAWHEVGQVNNGAVTSRIVELENEVTVVPVFSCVQIASTFILPVLFGRNETDCGGMFEVIVGVMSRGLPWLFDKTKFPKAQFVGTEHVH